MAPEKLNLRLEEIRTELSIHAKTMTEIMDLAGEQEGGVLTAEQDEKFTETEDKYDALCKEGNRLRTLLNHDVTIEDLATGRRTSSDSLNTGFEASTPTYSQFGDMLTDLHTVGIAAQSGIAAPQEVMERLAPTGSRAGIDSEGGFLIQSDFAAELFKRTYEMGQVQSRCRTIPIGANSDSLRMNAIDETDRANGSRFGGIRGYWTGEAAQMTGSRPTLRQIEIQLQDLTGLWYATDRLLADSTAMAAVAMEAFPEEFTFKIEDAILNGDGQGKPLGILNGANDAIVEVAAEGGQDANTILFANIAKMWTRMWARSRRTSVWLINQDVETELFNLEFPVGTGGVPAFLPPGGLSDSPYSTLFGRPVIPVEYCPTLGTAGDIIHCDFSQYLLINKGGVQSDSSIHLRFDFNETAFRWVMRMNGQPLWNNVLTPFQGTSTVAPFVSLATRA